MCEITACYWMCFKLFVFSPYHTNAGLVAKRRALDAMISMIFIFVLFEEYVFYQMSIP